MKLSEGQGAELLWRDSLQKQLAPLDALKIYALKTSPAFEAALYSGLRLGGWKEEASAAAARPESGAKPGAWVGQFARHLGVAFQILNDLNDWRGDNHNKLSAGGDVLGGRPTVLWALALEGLGPKSKAELLALSEQKQASSQLVNSVRRLYEEAGVFEKAEKLVDKYQERAEALADEVQPEELRRLLYYLIDTVLERPAAEPVGPKPVPVEILGLPIAPNPA